MRDFSPHVGEPVAAAPGIRRVTAGNPGPFTFTGTNSYILGRGRVAIVDPGPDDPAHRAALLAAAAGETVSHILVTHTHRDHSAGAAALKAATGAVTAGGGRHRPARPLRPDETLLDAGGDAEFAPDIVLADGDRIAGESWAVEAVATPGHTANHLAFAVSPAGVLLSGDHVMAWSTTIVAPPDGAMADYIASLDKLAARPETVYLPGHGGPVEDARRFVAALRAHRLDRERAILDRLLAGDETIPEMVRSIYRDVDPSLHGAAGLSVLAHLEDLSARGIVTADQAPALSARFKLAVKSLRY